MKHIVCFDPGHGPKTPNGSPDGTYKEQEFAWDMYTRIRSLLEVQGIEVVGTRKQTVKPSLTNRAKISNNANADLFVSIHTNAAGSGWNSARGFELFTSNPGDSAGRNILANKIIKCIEDAGVVMRLRPLLHKNFTVLTKTIAPACLIEYGFHTNREEVALLKDDTYRDKLAVATAKGICEYLGIQYAEQTEVTEMAVKEAKEIVKEKAKLSDATIQYLADYSYGNELIVKLAKAMV